LNIRSSVSIKDIHNAISLNGVGRNLSSK
jgi:hypothetical protein